MAQHDSAGEDSHSANPYASGSAILPELGDIPLSLRRRLAVEAGFLSIFLMTTTLGLVTLAMMMQLGTSSGVIDSATPTQSALYLGTVAAIAAVGLTIALAMRGRIQRKLRRVQAAEQYRRQMTQTVADLQRALEERRLADDP